MNKFFVDLVKTRPILARAYSSVRGKDESKDRVKKEASGDEGEEDEDDDDGKPKQYWQLLPEPPEPEVEKVSEFHKRQQKEARMAKYFQDIENSKTTDVYRSIGDYRNTVKTNIGDMRKKYRKDKRDFNAFLGDNNNVLM